MDCNNGRNLIERFKGNPIVAWIIRHQELSGILLLLLFMLIVAIGRWIQFSGNVAPPGSDGGQWLAFGHQLFGGEQVKAGFQSYPPVFPFFVKAVSLHDGLFTLKLLGILSSILICIPVYLLLRTAIHPWVAAILAITAASTPYQSEVLCFGGYPQLLGTSFLLLTIFLFLQGMNTGQKRWFLGASAATATTVGSNVLPAIVLLGAVSMILLLCLFTLWNKDRPTLQLRIRSVFIWWLIPSGILCLSFINTYWDYLFSAKQSMVNQRELELLDIFDWLSSSWQLEFILWVSISVLVASVVLLTSRATLNKQFILTTAAISLLLPSLIGFFILRELRFGAFVEIGIVLTLGLLLSSTTSILSRPATRQYLFVGTLIIVVTVVSVIGTIGFRRFHIAYDWYMVVDAEVIPAIDWLRENRAPDVKVAATGGERGQVYGWWIEGLTHMQTVMANDHSLFISDKELDQVDLAHRLLMQDTPPEVIRYLADTEDIQFLFLDTSVVPHPPDKFTEAGFVQVFGNGTIVIMQKETISIDPY